MTRTPPRFGRDTRPPLQTSEIYRQWKSRRIVFYGAAGRWASEVASEIMNRKTYLYPNATVRKRNHLPHVDAPGGLYFVTFCLQDAIPPGFAARLEMERKRFLAEIRKRFGTVRRVDVHQIERRIRKELFDEMDRGRGDCHLAKPEIGKLVTDSLLHFNTVRYALFDYSVMPNHVHAIFRPATGWPWWKITGGWKSFTSKEANKLLGRSGTFWQDDSWERLLRSERHLESAARYVLMNPERAGLHDWPWVGQLVFPPYDGI